MALGIKLTGDGKDKAELVSRRKKTFRKCFIVYTEVMAQDDTVTFE